ncbi:DUF881 domain-containing protein [Propionibacteriaceae bacterium G1746]|uniref:DUF881 domain-containing protein n=1 Tax=Aestuariimicrobium sp. G57 TaxID=3418485 RepID=UPI003C16EEBA
MPETPDVPDVPRRSLGSALRSFLRPSRVQFVLAIVLGLVAMATVWQFRAHRADETFSSLRRDELIGLLDQLNGSNNDLRKQVAEQEEARRQLQAGADSRRVAAERAQKRIQDLSILAGTAPAQGPGITITIQDPQGKVTPQLLLDGIEEMRDAGAEVMELNGVRVVASTWLSSLDGVVVVDGVRIRAPYVLRAIGEPHALEEGARFRGGLVSRAQAPDVAAAVTIVASDQITITSLHRVTDPRWAKPA